MHDAWERSKGSRERSGAVRGHRKGVSRVDLRAARIANTAVFFTTGLVFASWAARIPAVQGRLHLGNGELGLAVLGLEAGAIVGLPVGGAVVSRAGTRRALRLGFVAYPGALCVVGLAPSLGWLVAALAAFALANSVVDVAMNAQGAELE